MQNGRVVNTVSAGRQVACSYLHYHPHESPWLAILAPWMQLYPFASIICQFFPHWHETGNLVTVAFCNQWTYLRVLMVKRFPGDLEI